LVQNASQLVRKNYGWNDIAKKMKGVIEGL
jgi:hypothetical protein